MSTKVTSVCDRRPHFTISATLPDDVTYAILLLVGLTGKTCCLNSLLIPCSIDLAQGSKGLKAEALLKGVCAPSDDRTSLGLSSYSLIILTIGVSIDLGIKNHTSFCGFLVVCFCVSSSQTS